MLDEDHRRYPRVTAETTVLVESLAPDGAGELARTHSLGRGGCGFRSPEALQEGSILKILISAGTDVVKARGRVVYSTPMDNGFEIGVEFLEVDPSSEGALESLLEPA